MKLIRQIVRAALRVIAGLLIVLGLASLGFLAAVIVAGNGLSQQILGQVWFQHDPFYFLLHSPSIQLVQVFFERKLQLPVLWQPGVTTLLNWPSWLALSATAATLLVLGALLMSLARGRR